jgi:hypothetical protein
MIRIYFRKTPTNRKNETFSEFTQGKLQQINSTVFSHNTTLLLTIIPDNITEDSTLISHHTTADKLKVTSLNTSTLTLGS